MLDNPFHNAISKFDAYNSNDPHQEEFEGKTFPKELLYARRMSEKLDAFAPGSPEDVRLAARCQHIGRWEIPRDSYPMDRKGYLQWRSTLKIHHAKIAGQVLADCGYADEIIAKVKFLLLKKELNRDSDTQLLEDVICLVFIQYYLDEFAAKHDDDKVVDILQKTMKKMSPKAIAEAGTIAVSEKTAALINKAAAN